jgi:hypothetical protein
MDKVFIGRLLPSTVEHQAKILRDHLLDKIQQEGLADRVIAAALADVLGTIAAAIDNTDGKRRGTDSRMAEIEARVNQTYNRAWRQYRPNG